LPGCQAAFNRADRQSNTVIVDAFNKTRQEQASWL
jgi:hypothetical protein